MDENKVVELSDGRVMLNSRDSANGRLRKTAISTDGGATYGAVTSDAELPDPTNNASIIDCTPTPRPDPPMRASSSSRTRTNGANGDRVNGAVRVSCDDGPDLAGPAKHHDRFFAYSSATTLDDGRIGVLWGRATRTTCSSRRSTRPG